MIDCVDHNQNRETYGHVKRNGKTYLIHRWVYSVYHNIPMSDLDGYIVRHRCDNPRCINPLHLGLGTTQDNVDDRVSRGRSVSGEDVHTAKLTWDDVREIRSAYAAGETSYSQLATKYNVDKTNIACIIKHKTWKE